MLREETVRRGRWLDEREFLDLFGAVSVLPGPSSTQLAIALSRRRAGWAGLVVGGACFIAPAMAIVLGLAWAYVQYGGTPTGGDILYGVEPVIVAVVAVALWELARAALTRRWFALIGVMAIGLYLTGSNVLIPLLVGGVTVMLVANRDRLSGGAHAWLPLLPAFPVAVTGRARPGVVDVLTEFAKLGVVVFGSGYVLLAFLRADLVTHLHWLTERQALDAVAAGQVTPGPVFTTATFVGYLLGGVPLALAATAGIFLPSFVMVTALEPLVGRVRRSLWLGPALDGVTVAGARADGRRHHHIGRTAITDPLTAAVATVAFAVLLRWRPNAVWVVAAGAVAGIVHALV